MLAAQLLLYGQFGLAMVYVVTVLAMLPYYSGELLGLLTYDSLPAVAGLVLARRVRTGGRYVRWGLLAVAAVVALQALGSLRYGDPRGFTQLVLPVTLIVLLCRPAAREWFVVPPDERSEPRPFSFARMILWRSRDEGQNSLEYVGLTLIVVAIIAALLATNMGPELSSRFSQAICTVTGGGDCGGSGDGEGDGSDPVAEGPDEGPAGDGAKPEGGTKPVGGAKPAGGTKPGDSNLATMSGDGPVQLAPGPWETGPGLSLPFGLDEWAADNERHDKTFGDHFRGFFVSPAKNFTKGVGDFISDPAGEIKGAVVGLKDYTTDWFSERGDRISDAWSDGDYLEAGLEVFGTPTGFVSDLATDMFVDKENWKKGNYGAAIGNTALNLVGITSPKTIKNFKNLKKVGKDKGDVDGKKPSPLDAAGEAADKARKAAEKGDFDEARNQADIAQGHASEARKKAEQGGCKIALGGRVRVPYGERDGSHGSFGVPGSGHGVLASSQVRAIVFARKSCDEDDAKDAVDAQQKVLDARADILREALKDAKRNEGVNTQPQLLDGLLNRAKDNPDPAKKEIGKKEAADAIDDLTQLTRQKNIEPLSRQKLSENVMNAKDSDKLAENLAEANITQRVAANEADPAATVYSGVGDNKKRSVMPDGKGGEFDIQGIPDADVLYRGKDGTVNVVEVKNKANAATQASVPAQVKRLGDWQKAEPGRKARYELGSTERWDKIFDEFQYNHQSKTDKRNGVPKTRPEGTPATHMAQNDVGIRVGGWDLSPSQLKQMNDKWNAKSESEKYEARMTGKMKDPATAMKYLEVT
ncbi:MULTISPECIES: DUF4398 domain-containing protein [Streptomyces]|uniref:DUF4398 domain-containing protein n=1 Tax=Streptomyces solicathayae TaxID=3081768 RepID=A0ABZ0LXY1_9ACTN|nr:DUF4398 domain-containing protein [Streptomyces sp. HUAS YS2]WOX24021.1 DUF4398 domain-containing protein [Streptomyces sp. HUAS YS2]